MMDDRTVVVRLARAFVRWYVHKNVDPRVCTPSQDQDCRVSGFRLVGSLDSRQRLPNKQASNDDDDQDDGDSSSTQVTTHHHAVALVVPRYDDDDHDERLCGGPTHQNVLLVVAQHTQ